MSVPHCATKSDLPAPHAEPCAAVGVPVAGNRRPTPSRMRPAAVLSPRLLIGLLIAVSLAGPLWADDDDDESPRSSRRSTSRSADDERDEDDFTGEHRRRRRKRPRDHRPEDTSGIDGRVGFSALKTFGRRESIGHVELLPYVMADEHMLFGDLRGFIDTEQRFGGNFGAGYRYWIDGWERVVGGSVWYDIDETSGKLFHQAGFNLETWGERWDARTNLYFPIADTEQATEERAFNLRYSGENILFDYRRESLSAMQGFDMEIGLLLPSKFSQRHDLRVYGGWYRFTGKDVEDINGWKSRFQGHLTDSVTTTVEFTTDDTYGSTVMVGAAFEFSGGVSRKGSRSPERSQLMRRFAQRNFNIIVGDRRELQLGLTAINPVTGQPWTVSHVSSGAGGGGTGDLSDPFATIAAAQVAGRDLIFVHADSTFSTAVVLQPDEIVLGEGGTHLFSISGYGTHLLPRATGGSDLPVLQGIAGDAVTLASGATFAGFTIDGPTGDGIVGTNVDDAILRDVEILGAGGDGLHLTASSGSWALSRISIEDATGSAVHIDGGTASMQLSGQITNTSGRAVVIENTTSGLISLAGMTVSDTGGDGILLSGNDGDVSFGRVTSTNSTGNGVTIAGGSGRTDFLGALSVEGATGSAVDIQNAGETSIADLNIETDGQTGLLVRNSGRTVIADGTINAINGGAAVDVEDTEIDMALESVAADGGAFGIRLVNTPGQFVIAGSGAAGSGGLIQNMTTAGVVIQNAGTVALRSVDLDANDIGLQADTAELVVLQSSRVTDSTGVGVDLLDVQEVEVVGSVFTGNGGTSLLARMNTLDEYDYDIRNNLFEQTTGHAIDIATQAGGADSLLVLMVSQNEFTIDGNAASGVDVVWDGELQGTVSYNEFTGNGGSNIGVSIETLSTTESTLLAIGVNDFVFTGGNDTAIDITTAGSSAMLIESNTVLFDDPVGIGAANGTGMRFNLASQANVSLLTNTIIDNDSSGTGILFESINGPSTVAINGNGIYMLSTDANVDRGIVFSNVPAPITISGTLNNTISGATDNFLEPGNVNGSIIINNSLVAP